MKTKQEDNRPLREQVVEAILKCLIPAEDYVGCSGRLKIITITPAEDIRIAAQIRRCDRKRKGTR